MAFRLEDLIDRAELTDLTARWCRGVDRADEDLMRSCYHPDAVDDHGDEATRNGWDFAKHICSVVREGPIERFHHCLGSQHFEIDGDVAYGETYSIFHGRSRDGGGPFLSWSRYVDRFERREGVWRIAHRQAVVEWLGRLQVTDVAATTSFPQSQVDRTDPVYLMRELHGMPHAS